MGASPFSISSAVFIRLQLVPLGLHSTFDGRPRIVEVVGLLLPLSSYTILRGSPESCLPPLLEALKHCNVPLYYRVPADKRPFM